MAARDGKVELSELALRHGEARRLELPVDLHPIAQGSESYRPEPGVTPAVLDVSRTTTGHALRLRFETELRGPCVRCLEEAGVPLEIDLREVEQPGAEDEELRSPYVDDAERLDLDHWANDAIALALPSRPLCRLDCAGLCPVCGATLNDADPADHRHEPAGDPRMAKLRDLKLD